MITSPGPPARRPAPAQDGLYGIVDGPEPTPAALVVAATEWQMRRVAHEVHDTVGGALIAARLVVDRVKRDGASPDATDEALALLDGAIRDVRAFLRGVELPPLNDGGLVKALQRLISSYAAMGAFAGRVCRHPIESRLPYEVEVTAFRIAQEALTNAARHAGATFVEVDLRQRRRSMELTITDDGHGFDLVSAGERAGAGERLGLRGMLERAQMLGGSLDVRSEQNVGTIVRAVIPLPAKAAMVRHPRLKPTA